MKPDGHDVERPPFDDVMNAQKQHQADQEEGDADDGLGAFGKAAQALGASPDGFARTVANGQDQRSDY